MGKIKSIVFALALVPSALSAQVGEHRNDFAIGVSGGYTLNKVTFSPTIKQQMKGDVMFGFAGRYICEKYFTAICGVQAEVNYCNLGWQELIEDGSNNTYKRNLNYVQVPLLMQMGWGRERHGLKFVFEAGPQLGFYLDGSEQKGGGTWDVSKRPNGVVHQYESDIDNSFDYGIVAGAGVEVNTGIGHFILSGRYYYGLADIYDNSRKSVFRRSANATISAKITYLFDIVKTKDSSIK